MAAFIEAYNPDSFSSGSPNRSFEIEKGDEKIAYILGRETETNRK